MVTELPIAPEVGVKLEMLGVGLTVNVIPNRRRPTFRMSDGIKNNFSTTAIERG